MSKPSNPVDLAWDNYYKHGNYLDYCKTCDKAAVKPLPPEEVNWYVNAELQALGHEPNYQVATNLLIN